MDKSNTPTESDGSKSASYASAARSTPRMKTTDFKPRPARKLPMISPVAGRTRNAVQKKFELVLLPKENRASLLRKPPKATSLTAASSTVPSAKLRPQPTVTCPGKNDIDFPPLGVSPVAMGTGSSAPPADSPSCSDVSMTTSVVDLGATPAPSLPLDIGTASGSCSVAMETGPDSTLPTNFSVTMVAEIVPAHSAATEIMQEPALPADCSNSVGATDGEPDLPTELPSSYAALSTAAAVSDLSPAVSDPSPAVSPRYCPRSPVMCEIGTQTDSSDGEASPARSSTSPACLSGKPRVPPPTPLVNCRIGKDLHFVFPRHAMLSCTEEGCKKVFPVGQWRKSKKHLLSHLHSVHSLKSFAIHRWCVHCSRICPETISKHSCLRGQTFFKVHPDDLSACRFECRFCFSPFPSLSSLKHHENTHEPDPERVQATTNLAGIYSPISSPVRPDAADLPPGDGGLLLGTRVTEAGASPEASATALPSPGVSSPGALHGSPASSSSGSLVTVSPASTYSSDGSDRLSQLLLLGGMADPDLPFPDTGTTSASSPAPCSVPAATATASPECPVPASPAPSAVLSIMASPSSSLAESPTVENQSSNRSPAASEAEDPLESQAGPSLVSCSLPPSGFPGETMRIGRVLHFVLPVLSALRCTEDGCNASFSGTKWTSEKQSLKRHLEVIHKLPRLKDERWCAFCREPVPMKISSHQCLADIRFFSPATDGNDCFAFQCSHCNFSCASKCGFLNHVRAHRRDDLRARITGQRSSSNAPNATGTPPVSHPGNSAASTGSPPASAPGNVADDDSENEAEAPIVASQDPDVPDLPDNVFPVAPPDPDSPSPSAPFYQKFTEILNSASPDAWNTFTTQLEEFVSFAQSHVHLPPARDRPPATTRNSAKNPRYIQRLYRRNRRRAVRLITGESSTRCELPADVLARHFFPDAPPDPCADLFVHPSPAPEGVDMHPFSPEEVLSRLKAAENSAPGRDRLTYRHWQSVDPDGKALAVIFNVCLKRKCVPPAWKDSNTILIPKGGDGSSPSDWRPIALSCTIAKLFTSCLARRLATWLEAFDILSPSQKGFVPHDGAYENNYVLQQKMLAARSGQKELCILSLDVTNAFGSMPHGAIRASLKHSGAGDPFLELIGNIYTGSVTSLLTSGEMSPTIAVSAGVKQGCPLSGLLFNLAIDPLLRAVQPSTDSFSTLAFADDILLMAESPAELQTLADKASRVARLIGLTLNPGKCFSMHLGCRPIGCRPTVFTVQDTPVRALADGDEACFLGKPIGYNIVPDPANLESLEKAGLDILASSLAPWQQIDALKTFFYPSLHYAQRTNQFSKTAWKSVDDKLRPRIKSTLSLPPRASNCYLYGDREKGLMGIPLVAEDSDIALIDGACKLLTSKDGRVADLAWAELSSATAARTGGACEPKDMAEFLSGKDFRTTGNPISSIWTKARSASSRLGVSWALDVDRSVALEYGDAVVTDRRKIFKSLRSHFRGKRFLQLKELRHQGKTAACFASAKASTHYLHSGDFIRFCDFRFIHRARNCLVPLNGYRDGATDDEMKCRRCGYAKETLPHVVNHCRPHMQLITKRHNLVVSRLKKAAEKRWRVVRENQTVAGSSLRPDLVLERDGHALVIDVAVTFENGGNAFNEIRKLKTDKYRELVESLHGKYKTVSFEAVVVGSLGSWDKGNDRVVARLCSRKYASLLRKLVVSDTLRATRNIYIEHLTGVRQAPSCRSDRYVDAVVGLVDEGRNNSSNADSAVERSDGLPAGDATASPLDVLPPTSTEAAAGPSRDPAAALSAINFDLRDFLDAVADLPRETDLRNLINARNPSAAGLDLREIITLLRNAAALEDLANSTSQDLRSEKTSIEKGE